MKKRIILLITILFLLPITINAKDNYEIVDSNTYIEIKENTLEYTETISVNFSEFNKTLVKYLDKDLKNLSSNVSYSIEDKTNLKIKNTSLDPEYKFNYSYEYNKDNNKEIVISNSYESDIKNTSISILFDKKIYRSNITIYLNDKEIDSKDISIKLDGNKLYIEYYKKLSPNDKIIIKTDYSKVIFSKTVLISMIFPILFAIISYIIWYIYGKDLKSKPTKTSNLPSLNPLEVSIIYNEKVTKEDVFNFLLYLANKGYITIRENSKRDYYIVKNKPYDGEKYLEKVFLKTLFRKDKKISLTDYLNALEEQKYDSKSEYVNKLNSKETKNKFDRASNVMLSLMNRKEEKDKYYEKQPEHIKIILLLLVALTLMIITSIPFVEMGKLYLLPISVLFSIVTLKMLLDVLDKIKIELLTKKNIASLIIIFIVICLLISTPVFGQNRLYIISYLISCLSASFILLLYKFMPKRSIYGNKQFTKVKGFLKFIETCTTTEFKRVLEVNDNYLYDIYPYVLLLESENLLIDKIKDIDIKEPMWLETNDYPYKVEKYYNTINKLKEKLLSDDEK